GLLQVVHFHGEVMNAGACARGPRLGGFGAGVVLHDREVDRAVGEMARGMVAHLLRLGFLESEDLLVELGGALEVVDLERDVHDAVHGVLQKCPQARSSGLSVLTSLMPSRFQTVSQSLREHATPVTGAIRSWLFAATSSRLIGFSGVPRTARVWCLNSRPSFNLISTMPSRRGIACVSASSPRSSIKPRSSRIFDSRMRFGSCEDLKLTLPSASITAHRCCMQMSGMARLSVVFAPRCATRTMSRSTSPGRKRCARINSSSESSGAWIGDPTAQRLMSAFMIS